MASDQSPATETAKQPFKANNLKDQLYAVPQDQIAAFRFDDSVADVFADMVNRSVPGYGVIIPMIGMLAAQHVVDQTCVYDLGCSLGAGLLSIHQYAQQKQLGLIGVDNSEAMLQRCQVNLQQHQVTAELLQQDVTTLNFKPCSVVVLNFTLQFLPVSERLSLLTRIKQSLVPGGIVIVSEKIHFAESQQRMTDWYHAFKQYNGYSELEVSQKRSALENILVTDSQQDHFERFKQAGFEQVDQWFQCLNFVSFIAS